MIDHAEYVRARVLCEIADDFEELNQILIQLNRHTACFVFLREEIKWAIQSLLDLGWAKAYDLWRNTKDDPFPLVESPSVAQFDKLFFLITPAGLEALHKFPTRWFPPWNEDVDSSP